MPDDDEPEVEPVDETPDATDPESQKRVRRRSKKHDDERAEFWKRTLADPVGRLVLWELFRDYGVFGHRFAASPAGFPNPEATWFHLGQKDIGERLYRTLLRHDRLAVCAMHDEHDPD